jgi:hypothetical protein
MREYLRHALVPLRFYSVPVEDDDHAADGRETKLHFFQVLGVETKSILLPTFEDKVKSKALVKATVQHLEPMRYDDYNDDDEVHDVYPLEDPCDIDIIHLTGVDRANIHNILTWDASESDVAGCISLRDACVAKPSLPISSPQIPVLCLMDELDARHVAAVRRQILHAPGMARLEYDVRHAPSRRNYMQCVLALDAILELRTEGFPSAKSATFYRLLLKSPLDADDTMTAKECKRKFLELEGDMFAVMDLDRPAKVRAILPPVSDDDDIGGDAGSDTGPGGDIVPGVLALPAPSSPTARSAAKSRRSSSKSRGSKSSTSSSTSSSSAPSSALSEVSEKSESDMGGDVVVERCTIPEYPPLVAGRLVKLVKHVSGAREFWGLRIGCSNPHHGACNRFRSMRLWVDIFGRNAAAVYLEVWLSRAYELSEDQHRKWFPTQKQVQTFVQEGKSALYEVDDGDQGV